MVNRPASCRYRTIIAMCNLTLTTSDLRKNVDGLFLVGIKKFHVHFGWRNFTGLGLDAVDKSQPAEMVHQDIQQDI